MADPVKEIPEDEDDQINEDQDTDVVGSEEDDTVTEDEIDFLSMSDDDFDKQSPESAVVETPALTEDEETAALAADPESKDAGDKEDVQDATVEVKEKAPVTDPKPEVSEDPLEITDEAAVAAYKEMFKPFKANGRTVQAKTPEEAVRLMQMGAGHVKYQQRVKPMLATAKTLENAGISPDRLNFLIEIHNKDPEAIKKLVRDAGIDPFDINVDEASKAADAKYQPKNYQATEAQVTLEDTLADVQSSTEGAELLSSIRSSWDDASRKVVLDDPTILSVLTDQKQSGIYDQITAEVERRRTLGELANVPFINAYHQVGTFMEEQGQLKVKQGSATPANPLNQPDPAPAKQKSQIIAKKAAVPKKSNSDAAVKAIAPVKTIVAPKADLSNVMDMSDEDFAKIEGLEKFG